LVTINDDVPVPKVIDFGIAKATEQRLTEKTLFTEFQSFIGTPAYMSPEQAVMTSLDIDTRSDIYALGVLLYELLTGQTPFDAKELLAAGFDEMRRTLREKEPVRPSTRLSTMAQAELTATARHRSVDAPRLAPLLRGDLDWIVMKCLEKDRTRRYETANGLAMDLKRHLNNEPVVARPPSTAYRFQKAFRRNKLVFTAATAVAVALVAGVGVSTWQAIRATHATKAESQQRIVAERAKAQSQVKRQEAEAERERADAHARKAVESQQQSRRLLYAADMNLAQQSLKLNNLGRARRLLDRHRPQPGEDDLRGWEWRYLWQETRSSALVTLTNRPVRGFSVSFSPDGTRLAVGWYDGRVDLWDVPARRPIRALADREYLQAARVAFSPTRNLLAATSDPNVITLYDLDSGDESVLWRAPDSEGWAVRDLTFSQDGSKVVIYAGPSPRALFRVGAPAELADAAWVVNVATAKLESRLQAPFTLTAHHGAARISPDNRHLYLARSDSANFRYSIQCLDLASGLELWQTETNRDRGLSTLAVSPDGKTLASGSGWNDPAIRIWDATTGRPLFRLGEHTAWVCQLTFSKDGRQLISAGSDQSIRFWDTSTWLESTVLRGHSEEVHAIAMSERAQLLASTGKDGNLMLWNVDGKSTADNYSRLWEDLGNDELLPLDGSRFLLLPAGKAPTVIDLKQNAPPVYLPGIASSADVLGCFATNLVCHWNGTNQILVRELRGEELLARGAIPLDVRTRPTGVAYDPTRRLLAWSEGASSTSVYLASLATPGRRIELRSDVPGVVPLQFNAEGTRLAAGVRARTNLAAIARDGIDLRSLRVWDVETGQLVASANEQMIQPVFAAGGRVMAVTFRRGQDHEVAFYDLIHADRAPRQIHGREASRSLAVSPDGRLVASSTRGGLVRLFEPAAGELIEPIHGHLNGVDGVAFSADGRRLVSASVGREALKLWDVGTRQELLTLAGKGAGGGLAAIRWSADGDMILSGAPWQAWRAPSWEEIAAAEAKDPPSSDFGWPGKTEGKQP
jgi:WD40 repeat protein